MTNLEAEHATPLPFGEDAKACMAQAKDVSSFTLANYVGVEHLLSGLSVDSRASFLMKLAGVDTGKINRTLGYEFGARATKNNLIRQADGSMFDSDLVGALQRGEEFARSKGFAEVNSISLLSGVVLGQRSTITGILERLGGNMDTLADILNDR